MSWKGRTFDSRGDWICWEIHLRVDWGTVGLLVGMGLDCAIANRCPREADVCLSSSARSAYGIPSAIRFSHLSFGADGNMVFTRTLRRVRLSYGGNTRDAGMVELWAPFGWLMRS